MKDWSNEHIDAYNMKVKDWLDALTDENWHTERCVVEAILDGRESIIRRAMLIWLAHMEIGYMPTELCKLREQLYKEMEEE